MSRDEPYYSIEYDMKYGKGAFMKFLDERSFVIFGKEGNLIYQQTKVNGGIDPNQEVKYNKISFFGNNSKCHDAITFGSSESLLVVGCISAQAQTGEQTLWLQIIDRDTFQSVGKLQTFNLNKNTTDFRVLSKLTLRAITLKDA